ncbi:TraO protein, partial [Pseudomonas syringae pv. berberidis]
DALCVVLSHGPHSGPQRRLGVSIMANENDAKRDMKLTAALVGGALVVVFGGAYYLWDWLARPEPAQSKVDLGRVAQASRSH